MRIRLDHVTNSSSSSYIVYIEFASDKIEEFKEKIREYINAFNEEYKFRLKYKYEISDEDIQHIAGNVFAIDGYVSMYNSYDDIHDHLTYLLMSDKIEGGDDLDPFKYGIKSAKIKVIKGS